MKIVVADDEQLVRVSLISMLQDMEGSFEIAGEAAHGEQLVSMISEYKPEVAIVDIRMPGVDGIEAIRRGKAISPYTNWIIVSGLSDFNYAKQALKLGVSEYLTKPVDPDELEKVMNSICMSNKEYAFSMNQQFEAQLYSLCQGLITYDREPKQSIMRTVFFQSIIFYLDSDLSNEGQKTVDDEFRNMIRELIHEHLINGMNIASFSLTGSEYVVIGAWNPSKQGAYLTIHTFWTELERVASHYRSDHLAVTLVHSEKCKSYEAMFDQLQHIQAIAVERSVYGFDQSWQYTELSQSIDSQTDKSLGMILCQLKQDYDNQLYLSYQQTLDELDGMLRIKGSTVLTEQRLNNIRRYVHLAFGLTLSDSNDVAWISRLKQVGMKLLKQRDGESHKQDLIQRVQTYMEKHYMKNIGLCQIANEVEVTSSYLSTQFHRKTGTTFIKYLTKLRMLKAQELLASTNMQVQQVAEQVGYFSTRHFTKLFMEFDGTYPSDFKKMHNQPTLE